MQRERIHVTMMWIAYIVLVGLLLFAVGFACGLYDEVKYWQALWESQNDVTDHVRQQRDEALRQLDEAQHKIENDPADWWKQ